MYPTAVFLDCQEIVASRSKLDEHDANYVMGVSTYNYHPVQALREEKGYLTSMWPEYQVKKSQDYPQLVVSNGTLYWAKVAAFERDMTFYGPRLVGHLLESIDVDTQEDYRALLEHPRWLICKDQ
jgi:CMP-N-acetylneuraminic acid synthetase